jgi:Putative polyhydroxyalkanoic acid system protein (PHA_gran_rgn)
VTFQHGQTLDEARRRLTMTVDQLSGQLGVLVRQVEWTADRNRVKLEGIGFWVEIWVDPQAVHATGDVPLLGALLGRSLGTEVTQILQQTFRKQLS